MAVTVKSGTAGRVDGQVLLGQAKSTETVGGDSASNRAVTVGWTSGVTSLLEARPWLWPSPAPRAQPANTSNASKGNHWRHFHVDAAKQPSGAWGAQQPLSVAPTESPPGRRSTGKRAQVTGRAQYPDLRGHTKAVQARRTEESAGDIVLFGGPADSRCHATVPHCRYRPGMNMNLRVLGDTRLQRIVLASEERTRWKCDGEQVAGWIWPARR
jgi:hypothetical protein